VIGKGLGIHYLQMDNAEIPFPFPNPRRPVKTMTMEN